MIKDPYKNLAKFYDTFIEPSTFVLRKIILCNVGSKPGYINWLGFLLEMY